MSPTAHCKDKKEFWEESVSQIQSHAIAMLRPKRIFLFGSRARKTHHPHSDIDLAFELDDQSTQDWPLFVAEMDDDAPTLLPLDLVLLNDAALDLRKNIEKEGIVLYER